MVCLEKHIGQLIPVGQEMVTASESDSMVKIAKRMNSNASAQHLSQIPLKNSMGKILHVVTGNGLARWGMNGSPNQTANEYSELAHRFCEGTTLGDIIETVRHFGYVLVTDADDYPLGIVSYTDVIAELMQTH